MNRTIAIIGDRFMLPQVFADKIIAACGDGHTIRMLEQPWPDAPMEHGYAKTGLDGLKEYFGKPDEVAEAIYWLIASGSMMTGSLVDLDFGMHLNAT